MSFLVLHPLISSPDQLPPRSMSPAQTTGLSSGTECHLLGGPGRLVSLKHFTFMVQPGAARLPSPNPCPLPGPGMRVLSCPRRDPRVILASHPRPHPQCCPLSFQCPFPACLLCPVLVTLTCPAPCSSSLSWAISAVPSVSFLDSLHSTRRNFLKYVGWGHVP